MSISESGTLGSFGSGMKLVLAFRSESQSCFQRNDFKFCFFRRWQTNDFCGNWWDLNSWVNEKEAFIKKEVTSLHSRRESDNSDAEKSGFWYWLCTKIIVLNIKNDIKEGEKQAIQMKNEMFLQSSYCFAIRCCQRKLIRTGRDHCKLSAILM